MIPTLRSNHKLAAWVAICAVCLIASFAVAGYTIGHGVSTNADRLDAQKTAIHESCLAIQNLNRVITQQLVRARQNLTRLAYYRVHRGELRFQQHEITRELAVFRPRECR